MPEIGVCATGFAIVDPFQAYHDVLLTFTRKRIIGTSELIG